jgi:hypothetical protein
MSAVSDDTQDGLAIHKVQPKKLAGLQFALDQHAIVAATDIRGTINSVNEKFAISQYSKVGLIGQNHRLLNSGYHSQEIFEQLYRAIANGKAWHGAKQPGLRTVRPTGWTGPAPLQEFSICPYICPSTANHSIQIEAS